MPFPSDVPERRRPIAIDLFAGVGGMSLGFEQAGFDVLAAVEYDPVHAAAHLFNFPSTEMLCRNITKLSGLSIKEAARVGYSKMYPGRIWDGVVDAVIGGPPCQGFSTGGKRSASDERNNLLLEFVRIVEEIRPRVFCLENVAGLLEHKFSEVRLEALRRLRGAGYAISGFEKPLNSMLYGVPQSRRRVFITGSLDGKEPGLPPVVSPAVSVQEALSGLPSPSKYSELLASDQVALDLEDRNVRDSVLVDYVLGLNGGGGHRDKARRRPWNQDVLTGSRYTVHAPETVRRFASTERGTVEPKSRLYRLPLDGPSRTLRAGTGSERGSHTSPRPIHPVEDRVVTVREAARLHGYPDWFRFHSTNWHGHRQIGNSVPPPLARAVAVNLLEVLGTNPSRTRAITRLGDVELLRMPRSVAALVLGAVDGELPAQRIRTKSKDDTTLLVETSEPLT